MKKKIIFSIYCYTVLLIIFSCNVIKETRLDIIVESMEDNKLEMAKITLVNSSGKEIQRFTNKKGKVFFKLSCKETYVLIVEKDRFYSEKKKLTIPCNGEDETIIFRLKNSWVGH